MAVLDCIVRSLGAGNNRTTDAAVATFADFTLAGTAFGTAGAWLSAPTGAPTQVGVGASRARQRDVFRPVVVWAVDVVGRKSTGARGYWRAAAFLARHVARFARTIAGGIAADASDAVAGAALPAPVTGPSILLPGDAGTALAGPVHALTCRRGHPVNAGRRGARPVAAPTVIRTGFQVSADTITEPGDLAPAQETEAVQRLARRGADTGATIRSRREGRPAEGGTPSIARARCLLGFQALRSGLSLALRLTPPRSPWLALRLGVAVLGTKQAEE